MKRFALACLLAAAACGGGNKSSTTTMPSTGSGAAATPTAPDCKAAADKVANGDMDLSAKLEARCQSDAWNDESRACLAEKGEAGPCVLSDAQKAGIEQERAKAVEKAVEKAAEAKEQSSKMSEESAKEAPKNEAPRTRAPVKKDKGAGKTADPCEGGE